MTNLNKLSTRNLVSLYNHLTDGKMVNRFASRSRAEVRVNALINELPDREVPLSRSLKELKSSPKNKKMSEAVSKSWRDVRVAIARSKRHAVEVNGMRFKSVSKALSHYNLSHPNIRKFRAELVSKGKNSYEGYKFKLAA